MKRTELQRGNKPLNRGTTGLKKGRPLKKQSVTYLSDQEKKDAEKEQMKLLFLKIWNILYPHQRVCYETGRLLFPDDNGFPLMSYFHHVLPKERYPQFALSPWNIILLAPDVHSQAETSIDLVPKVKELYLNFMSKIHTLQP